jgi:predicted dehydrogenase
MSPKPLRVAVVGVGHLGKFHARIYSQNPGAELVGVVDFDQERAAALAQELGCESYASIADLPADLDAVSVVVPTSAHAETAIPLLESGVPCLVEKPLALNVEEADRIIAAAEKGGVALAVGHVERFQPGVRKLKELDMQPKFIECHRLTGFSFRSMDVGVVHDLMIHDLDLILHLVGDEVESVDAVGGEIITDSEDMASVRLVFRNGARASVSASRVSLQPMRRFRMFSSSGYVSLDFAGNEGLYIRKGPDWDGQREKLLQGDPGVLASKPDFFTEGMMDIITLELADEERPLQAELDSFLSAVREGNPPEVTGQHGRRALALADQIADQIRQQSW